MKAGIMVSFRPVPVEPASVLHGEFAGFCGRYGITVNGALPSNDGMIEDVLAKVSLMNAPSLDGYLRHLSDPSPAEQNAAAHTAVNEWNDKVGTARRLFLQFYHVNRGMTSMTDDSVREAAKAVGLVASEKAAVTTAEYLVR